MKVGILGGTGRVGGALGRLWAESGHEVSISFSRDRDRLEEVAGEIGAQAVEPEDLADSDVLVLATPAPMAPEALEAVGELDGAVLVDATNGMGRPLEYVDEEHGSLAESIAALAPGARVVKAFNTVFAPVMDAGPDRFDGEKAMILYCGDAAAKEVVATLIEDAGFEPVDLGGLDRARLVEEWAATVITLAYQRGLGPFGLKVQRL
jgi:predicted dinucleotide-binding enzyme